jgi:integrase
MTGIARKLTIPIYVVTELCASHDLGAAEIALPDGKSYFARPKKDTSVSGRIDGKSSWVASVIHRYPIVLRGDGSPWDEANLYLFRKIEQAVDPDMSTFSGVAEDLTAYCRFLEDVPPGKASIDWTKFPAHQNAKPTFRYRGYLTHKIWAGELKRSTAQRRMGCVVRFYRWLIEAKLLCPDNPPWRDEEKLISVNADHGQQKVIKVTTTNLRIPIAKQNDPYDGTIEDGGMLRPLLPEEQDWVVEALEALGNTEMMLIHAFALLTGARIQTVLTAKVKHVLKPAGQATTLVWNAGPGTGIDTKNNKQLRLHVPGWFYNSLQTYALSERARKRRLFAVGGDHEEQYLFLSHRHAPLYLSKSDKSYLTTREVRHRIAGQGVRQYMTEFVLPFIHSKYDRNFKYRFHDLRATFGMNLVDHFAPMLEAGQLTYTDVLNFVSTRLGHDSLAVTERYFKFGNQRKIIRRVQDEWETHVKQMVQRGMGANSGEI